MWAWPVTAALLVAKMPHAAHPNYLFHNNGNLTFTNVAAAWGVGVAGFSNGAALWTTQLPGYWYDASPNAYGGNVFIVGNGGLSAVDETSGNILWTTTSAGSTDWDSPAISSEGAYAESGNCLAGAYDPTSGASIWQVLSQCKEAATVIGLV